MTFRRYVRPYGLWYSSGVPVDVVKDEIRRQLHQRKHTVIETSWTDVPDPTDFTMHDQRVLTVRYVTGGMRHGLGPSIEYPNGRPDVVVFPGRSDAHTDAQPPTEKPG